MPLSPIIFCFIKINNGLTILVSAYPGCSAKEAVKWVSVLLITDVQTTIHTRRLIKTVHIKYGHSKIYNSGQ